MSRLYSNSSATLGVIEDVETSHLKQPVYNLRSAQGSVDELTSSIKEKGLLQPIVARPHSDGYFEIVAGSRRYLSCKTLGWRKIPCHIVDLNDKEAFEISLVENVQRKSLSLLDEARSFKMYVDDFGWGAVSELAKKIGKSGSYVTKRIQLLHLPADVIDSITKSDLSSSVAEELCYVKNKDEQSKLAKIIATRRLSFRKTRELVKNNSFYDESSNQKSKQEIRMGKAQRSFDRAIVTLRIAMNRIGSMVEDSEYDTVVRNILMYHKNMLHEQIGMLIKEKRKFH